MKIIKKSKLNTHVYQYKNTKGKFWGYRLKYYDHTGKRREKTRNSFKFEHEAIDDYFELQSSIKMKSGNLKDSEITISDWLDKYKDIVKDSLDVSTYKEMLSAHNNIKKKIGHIKLREMTVSKYQTLYIDELKHLKHSTVENYHSKVNVAFKMAIRYGIIEHNPIERATLPKSAEPDKKRFLEKEELESLLDYVNENHKEEFYLIVLLISYTGARVGEVLALTWEDFNFDNNTIEINKTVKSNISKRIITKTKGRNIRRIKVDSSVMQLMKQYKKTAIEKHFSYKVPFNRKTNVFNHYIVSNPAIKPIRWNSINIMFRKYSEKHDTKITAHDLRHTHASYLLANNVPHTTVAKRLGHTVAMLLKTYAHAIPSRDESAVTAFNEMLGQNLGQKLL